MYLTIHLSLFKTVKNTAASRAARRANRTAATRTEPPTATTADSAPTAPVADLKTTGLEETGADDGAPAAAGATDSSSSLLSSTTPKGKPSVNVSANITPSPTAEATARVHPNPPTGKSSAVRDNDDVDDDLVDDDDDDDDDGVDTKSTEKRRRSATTDGDHDADLDLVNPNKKIKREVTNKELTIEIRKQIDKEENEGFFQKERDARTYDKDQTYPGVAHIKGTNRFKASLKHEGMAYGCYFVEKQHAVRARSILNYKLKGDYNYVWCPSVNFSNNVRSQDKISAKKRTNKHKFGRTKREKKKFHLRRKFRGVLFHANNPFNPLCLQDEIKFPKDRFPIRITDADVIDGVTEHVLSAKICDLCGKGGGKLVFDHYHCPTSEPIGKKGDKHRAG